MTQNS